MSQLCFVMGQAMLGGSCPLPPRGASHLGAGGTTLAGTAGLSSFTLRRRTADWWHVPKPGSSCLPGVGGLAGPSGPKVGWETPSTGHLHHLRSCQGGRRDHGDPWDPRREGVRMRMLWVAAVPCHPATQAGQCQALAAPSHRSHWRLPRVGVFAVAVAESRWSCPHPQGTSGWRRRWQHSQKHQALQVHRGDLGNLEDPADQWGKEKKKGKKWVKKQEDWA